MRNIFDQYSQPENRLTHALAVCLNEDRALVGCFLKRLDVDPPPGRLIVVEQTLPGEAPPPEGDDEGSGLPDVVIHDDDAWCVLIESKVQAALELDQLTRHAATLRRRGFQVAGVVALTKSGVIVPPGVTPLAWSDLYAMLGEGRSTSPWARRLREYLGVAEVRLAREGYLTEGTLTMFDGFKFDADHPYSYGEGKRLLKLAMADLRKSRALLKLGMDPKAPGRPAITGRDDDVVWDFLQLRDRPQGKGHTAYPHLTLDVHADHLGVQLAVPNGTPAPVRRRLSDLGVEGLIALNRTILRNARPVLPAGAWIQMSVIQRHHTSQRAPAIEDASLTFKLETTQPKARGGVRRQLEWVETFAALLRQKRSNLHFGYVAVVPWGCKGLDSKASLAMIASLWCAMEPALRALQSCR